MNYKNLALRLFIVGTFVVTGAFDLVWANGPVVTIDPVFVFKDVRTFVSNPKTFNAQSCEQTFKGLASIVDRLQPRRMNPEYFSSTPPSSKSPEVWMKGALEELWQIRLGLRDQWLKWTPAEREQYLPYFRTGLRYVQGMSAYLLSYLSSKKSAPENYFLPGTGFEGFEPSKDIKAGDILLSSGAAVVSALIRRLPNHALSYSHAAIVANENGKLFVIEAIIEPGKVVKVPLQEWLRHERASFAIYRAEDQTAASRAGEFALSLVGKPYDFSADESNNRINCIEVPRLCYQSASGFVIPEFKSVFSNNPRIRKALSLPETTPAPGDIEFTQGLALVGEWRDPAKMSKAHETDVTISALLKWDQDGYRVKTDWLLRNDWLLSLGVHTAILGRKIPIFGDQALGKSFPKSIPADALKVIVEYRRIYSEIEQRLNKKEEAHQIEFGFPMTFFEKEAALEEIKIELINAGKLVR